MKTLSTLQEQERVKQGQDVTWVVRVDWPAPTGPVYYTNRIGVLEGLDPGPLAEVLRVSGLMRLAPGGFSDRSARSDALVTMQPVKTAGTQIPVANSLMSLMTLHNLEGVVVRVGTLFKIDGSEDESDIAWGGLYKVDSFSVEGQWLIDLYLVDYALEVDEIEIGRVIKAADFPLAPDESFGKLMQIVWGKVRDLPLIPVAVGWESKLDGSILADDLIIAVDRVDNWPGGNVVVQIGAEWILVTAVDEEARTLGTAASPCQRGYLGSLAAEHGDREIVRQSTTYFYLVADHECKSVGNVRIGERVLAPAEYEVYTEEIGGQTIQALRTSSLPILDEISAASVTERLAGPENWAVAAGNAAADAAFAFDEDGVFTAAVVSPGATPLRLTFTRDLTAFRGVLKRLRLLVEYQANRRWAASTHPLLRVWKDAAVVKEIELDRPSEVDVHVEGDEHDHSDLVRYDSRPLFQSVQQKAAWFEFGPTSLGAGVTNPLGSWDRQFQVGTSPMTLINGVGGSYDITYKYVLSQGTGAVRSVSLRLAHAAASADFFILDLIGSNRHFNNPQEFVIARLEGNFFNQYKVENKKWTAGDPTHGFFYGTNGALTRNGYQLRLEDFTNALFRVRLQINKGLFTTDQIFEVWLDVEHDLEIAGASTNIEDQRTSGGTDLQAVNGIRATSRVTKRIDLSALAAGDWDWAQGVEIEVTAGGVEAGLQLLMLNFTMEAEYRAVQSRLAPFDVIADVEGRMDTVGDLIENPADVLLDLLVNFGGVLTGYIDTDSFAAARDDLAARGYKFARALRSRESLGVLMGEAAWQARSRFGIEADKFRMKFRRVPAVEDVVFDITDEMVLTRRPLMERSSTGDLKNEVAIYYDENLDDADAGALRVAEARNDTSIDLYGLKRKTFNAKWFTNREDAAVQDLVNFLTAVMSVKRSIVEIETPPLGVALETDDVVSVELPGLSSFGEVVRTVRRSLARVAIMINLQGLFQPRVDSSHQFAWRVWEYDALTYIEFRGPSVEYVLRWYIDGRLVAEMDKFGNWRLRGEMRFEPAWAYDVSPSQGTLQDYSQFSNAAGIWYDATEKRIYMAARNADADSILSGWSDNLFHDICYWDHDGDFVGGFNVGEKTGFTSNRRAWPFAGVYTDAPATDPNKWRLAFSINAADLVEQSFVQVAFDGADFSADFVTRGEVIERQFN